MRRRLPVIGLFLLAPVVAEYLLGNLPINALHLLVLMAPLYGGGALLIRELARRTGRGWPTIVVLGLAYGVLEEGAVSQSLFNPDYGGYRLLEPGYIPALGMGAWWTVFVLALHTIGSISVPIAVVETMAGSRRTEPWLSTTGVVVTAVLFAAGLSGVTALTLYEEGLAASPAQLAGTLGAVMLLVAGALRLRRSASATPEGDRPAPRPWRVGAASLLASVTFLVATFLVTLPWVMVGVCMVLVLVASAAVTAWSRRKGWSDAHRLALTIGPLTTYAGYAFPSPAMYPASDTVDLVGNAVFALGAAALVGIAALKVRTAHHGRVEPGLASLSTL